MARRLRRLRRQAQVRVVRTVRAVAAAPRTIITAVRNPRRTVSAIRQSKTGGMVIESVIENLLEAAGGTTSAMVDAYVQMTGTKTDDEYAPLVKGLVANGLKVASRYKGGKALNRFATALNGHNYGEYLSRKALDAFKTPAKK